MKTLFFVVLILVLFIGIFTGVREMKTSSKLEMLYSAALITVDGKGGGSGIVIHSDNKIESSLIITARHVVKDAEPGDLWVTLYPSGLKYPASVIRLSDMYDLALIRVDVYHPNVAKLGKVRLLLPFTEVTKIGSGLGMTPFPTTGIVESFSKTEGLMTVSSPVIFGDSGGGIFIKEKTGYRLVGIVIALPAANKMPISHMGIAHNVYAIMQFLGGR